MKKDLLSKVFFIYYKNKVLFSLNIKIMQEKVNPKV